MIGPSLEEIITVITKAKELDVEEFEWNGIRVRFRSRGEESPGMDRIYFPEPETKKMEGPVPDQEWKEIFKPLSPLDDLSPEEILFYATPRFDEIQAEKEAHRQKLILEGSQPS